MRILFTIAHFFNDKGGGFYGSLKSDPAPRIAALRACILSLHENFSVAQGLLDGSRRRIVATNSGDAHQVEVVVCTVGDKHLLAHLSDIAHLFTHRATDIDNPMLLGFECHEVLRARSADYDYYAYLEDDIQVRDPYFFRKLVWFNANFGNAAVLQANRYEVHPTQPLCKLYIDGNLARPEMGRRVQDLVDMSELSKNFLGGEVRFGRINNPHSGCFFLNATQLRHWSGQPYFLDRDTAFAGPLESAATLGIAKTFKVYKPLAGNAAFLEVCHLGNRYLGVRIRLDSKDLTRF